MKLDHSLINSNQLRHYGVEVNDNPYDSSNALSITFNEELIFQMNTKGTKIRFETRVPTTRELNEYLKVDTTSSVAWEPAHVSME